MTPGTRGDELPMSIAAKTARWVVFLPAGWLGGILAGALIWLPFAAPYLLFHKLAGLAILGFAASYAMYVYAFLGLSWFIAPTKSKVEAWLILVVGFLISLSLLVEAISLLKHVGAPLLGAVIGCIHVFRFFRTACLGSGEFD